MGVRTAVLSILCDQCLISYVHELLLLYFSRVALLAGGDVLALFLFSAIGRFNHGFSVFDLETLRTADPFIAGELSNSLLVLFISF